MKIFPHILILIFVLVAGSNGQTVVNEPKWRNLAPESEEFSVDVPIELDVVTNSFESIVFEQSYKGRLGDTYFFIFSDDIEDGDGHTNVRLAVSTYTSEQVGEIPTNRKFASYSFDSGDGFFHRIMLTQTNKRIYSFHTVSLSPDDPLVERFFNTLKIDNVKANRIDYSNGDRLEDIIVEKTDPRGSSVPGKGIGSARGGNYEPSPGSSLDTSSSSRDSKVITAPLTLTSKPRPTYTELARVYSVSGTVQLRVSFEPDGRIGNVAPVSRLPFGLTESAIKAAEKIQFRPRIEGGKPVTTSRTVEYSFTLY